MPFEMNAFIEAKQDAEDNLISTILDEAAARWEEDPERAVVCCTEER
ncbi:MULTISPECIES: hypothetical protein [unclassified Pseudomonas]|nr:MULTISPECIES: hypothetical protein [unclassified Pseudomonas]UMZ09811.1 hypothetical protein I9018_20130 [Pseudomonas sp. MPFS]